MITGEGYACEKHLHCCEKRKQTAHITSAPESPVVTGKMQVIQNQTKRSESFDDYQGYVVFLRVGLAEIAYGFDDYIVYFGC